LVEEGLAGSPLITPVQPAAILILLVHHQLVEVLVAGPLVLGTSAALAAAAAEPQVAEVLELLGKAAMGVTGLQELGSVVLAEVVVLARLVQPELVL
jgi:hypothetical protein